MSTITFAGEESTFAITVTGKDSAGATISASAISSMTWTLTDGFGVVINDREDEEITPVANPKDIVLSGDDLSKSESGTRSKRILLVKAIYTGSLGADLPLNGQYVFYVEEFPGV